ncbi:ArnT family glycosyltransferase [Lutibaculum baratangense]|uniref:Glycosyltransferase RgtA/B/C/D-like domain-containing protein n=1 Tax=Lutibaculum baratangense AMV1 TaxID=631454 RepID=V4R0U6_9HYPH|nr:glycosyltransferase family 39 protein [Lutibaculum baratangense]ESR25627.1 hypothetical protein N177_1460 [Lutibaculum baratangense AMV1]
MAEEAARYEQGAAAAMPGGGDQRVLRALGRVSASTRLASLVLVLFCLLAYLPGVFTVPLVDRDEARFVQTTKQMVESGDPIDLRLHEENRYKKPVGIYWLQAASTLVSGYGAEAPVWVYRLVSLLGAILAVLLTFRLGRPLVGAEAAFAGALFLAACIILNVEARLAKTDAVLLATVMAAQLALARVYFAIHGSGHGKPPSRAQLALARVFFAPPRTAEDGREPFGRWPFVFWAAIGVGILVKGPVTAMVAGLTAGGLAVLDRRAGWLKRLRPLPGLLVVAVIVLPWLVAINVVSEGRFLQESLGNDMLGKIAEGQESHGAPPGYHFLLFWVLFWPSAALLGVSIPAIWRSRREPATSFLLAWILPSFIVFEVVATKLPHYTLPVYPAIALLAASALVAGKISDQAWARLFMMASGVGGGLTALAGLGLLAYLEGVWSLQAVLMAAAATGLGAAAAWEAAKAHYPTTMALLLAQAVIVYATVFGTVAPRLDSVWVSPRLAAAAEAAAACENPHVFSAGFTEASLVFAVGTDIRFGSGEQAADFLSEGGCRVVVVTDRQSAAFVSRAQSLGFRPVIAETLSGINIGNSRWLTFQIATPAP